jgi:hypothetical protein
MERVVNNFNSVDRVLKFFLPLAGLTCLLKFTNKLTLSVSGLEVPTKWAWAVFVVFTFAHLFTTWRFQQSARQFTQRSTASDRQNVFDKISSSGGPWIRNLLPRRKRGHFYRMKLRDPSTIFSYAAAVVMLVAIIQFDLDHPWRFTKYSLVALVIVIANWLIGSRWAVTISEFAGDGEHANVAFAGPNAPLSL